jgi:hypothetical protein
MSSPAEGDNNEPVNHYTTTQQYSMQRQPSTKNSSIDSIVQHEYFEIILGNFLSNTGTNRIEKVVLIKEITPFEYRRVPRQKVVSSPAICRGKIISIWRIHRYLETYLRPLLNLLTLLGTLRTTQLHTKHHNGIINLMICKNFMPQICGSTIEETEVTQPASRGAESGSSPQILRLHSAIHSLLPAALAGADRCIAT